MLIKLNLEQHLVPAYLHLKDSTSFLIYSEDMYNGRLNNKEKDRVYFIGFSDPKNKTPVLNQLLKISYEEALFLIEKIEKSKYNSFKQIVGKNILFFKYDSTVHFDFYDDNQHLMFSYENFNVAFDFIKSEELFNCLNMQQKLENI